MNGNDERIVANIRCLAIDMINEAKSGHPGIALGAAPIIYSVYANHLRFSNIDDKWFNRDRFIMSAGHGSALLYAMLYMASFNLSLDDLKSFRQLDSKTPGHPEINITPGVDASTGPLGQGFATAVGIALGERYISNLINKYIPNQNLINYNTYVLCGDGDLMEGVSYEAASFAGTQKLGKLIVLYDSNNISLDAPTYYAFREDIKARFESMGWHYDLVKNGEDLSDISRAIDKAKEINDRPSLIEIKTKIGFGSIDEGKNSVHGKPLRTEDIVSLKTKLGIPNESFYINEDGKRYLNEKIKYRMDTIYTEWGALYNNYKNNEIETFEKIIKPIMKGELSETFEKLDLKLPNDFKQEVRVSNMNALNYFAKNNLSIVGGSADLSSSTKTYIGTDDIEIMNSENPIGRNIYFGVREHAMASILNGLALTGLRPFGSTFLSFADYLKPAIRMTALMNLPVTYIFTHDSITVGPDGPTHEPVEQIAMLRGIPNFNVYRPVDINEVYGSWLNILNNKYPSALIINKSEM